MRCIAYGDVQWDDEGVNGYERVCEGMPDILTRLLTGWRISISKNIIFKLGSAWSYSASICLGKQSITSLDMEIA